LSVTGAAAVKPKRRDYWSPSYDGGGFLNLIASIGVACGATDSPYPPLSSVDTTEWARARNLILLLVDGLGADYIEKHAGGGLLHRHQLAVLTSICPTTTSAAIPTAMSGLAPAAHALTGWHMYVPELNAVTAVLPLAGRGAPLPDLPASAPENLFGYPTFFQQLRRPSRVVTPRLLAESAFSVFHSQGAVLHPYYSDPYPFFATMPFWRRRLDMFGVLRRLCHERGPASFTYAYWPYFDSAAHEAGIASDLALSGFRKFEEDLEEFLHSVRGTDTMVIVTADHGFIDSPAARQIHLADHAELARLLVRPLCGERRFAYGYVRPDAHRDFESYIDDVFSGIMEAWPRDRLLDEQWFGAGPVNPRLAGRVGDYVLAMKDDWTISDHVPGERRFNLIGVHGGLSAAEMHIPLCVLCQA
jgi:hypothetical protein